MCKIIGTFSDFVREVLSIKENEIDDFNRRLADGELLWHEKCRLLYRGQSSIDYELAPSIARDKSHPSDYCLLEEERNFIESCKFMRPDIFRNDMSSIELLALLQHHRVNTRLLDVTENPLVALYFACTGNTGVDGELFIIKKKYHQVANFPIMEMIASTYKIMLSSYDMSLEEFYNKAYRMGYELNTADSQEGAEWIERCCKEPFIIYAPIHTLRQQNQMGQYMLFPNMIEYDNRKNKKVFRTCIKPIEKNDACIVNRLIIPASAKVKMMSDLRTFGISREVLFGDNIDVVCEEIVKDCMCRL